MSTIVFVHAHPDDEASQSACSMARAVQEGHRVVLVIATNGDHGEPASDLADGETVVMRRRLEAEASAAAIGTHRIVWLGYADSGMTGWAQNEHDDAFMRIDVEEAAERLAEVLREEAADVVVGYDWHGGYGHPDHVQSHRVTKRAAEIAGTARYLEGSMNRDAMTRAFEAARAAGMDVGDWDPSSPMDDGNPMGTPEAELHWACDLRDWVDVKRRALQAHASQTSDVGMILAFPEDAFREQFGWEHYIEPARPAGMVVGWFLDPALVAATSAAEG